MSNDNIYAFKSNITNLNSIENNLLISNENIPSFNHFVDNRVQSLNFGLRPGIIRNMTSKESQIDNSLNLLNQTDYLNITSYNKNSKLENENNIVSNNKIEDKKDINLNSIQGIATPFIPQDKYENPNAYFDNFNNVGRTEIVKNYICHISSIDRDIVKYPNSFNFLVKFRPNPEDTDANIPRIFNNIRLFRIENISLPRKFYLNKSEIPSLDVIKNLFNPILPNTNIVILDNPNNWIIIYSYTDNDKQIINYTKYEEDISTNIEVAYECIKTNNTFITYKYTIVNKLLEEEKYVLIYINDINNISENSTNRYLSTAFNVLYPDTIGKYYMYIDCHNADKLYDFSDLGSMNRMLINFKNALGTNLTTNIKAQDYNVPNLNLTTCICSYDDNNNIVRNYSCLCNYIRHPRYCKFQVDLMFKYSIIENNFDKRIFN
jgi:hypothetical protein